MNDAVKRFWREIILSALLLASAFVWYAVYLETPSRFLTVAVLNVGQGDAIYIESPTGNEVLIDGGPPRAVLGELRSVMPFYDRTIDTLIVSNPDKDHIAGFVDILRSYRVKRIIVPGTHSSSSIYAELENIVKEKNIERIIAKRGMRLSLGGGAVLDILFPDRDVSGLSTNNGSIIARLAYGSTSAMFVGDAPSAVEEYVTLIDNVDSDILKVGHHGSRTSVSEEFIAEVTPAYAVISAGLNNSYGHPHKETIDQLQKFSIPYFVTADDGRVIFTTDGKVIQEKTER